MNDRHRTIVPQGQPAPPLREKQLDPFRLLHGPRGRLEFCPGRSTWGGRGGRGPVSSRLAPDDGVLGGKRIRKRQAVIAVMAAGNRDPERFPDPDCFDITRTNNRHLAFGWAAHFCFGAALARIEGQTAFELMLSRLPGWALETGPLVWRTNLGLRGLTRLPIRFDSPANMSPAPTA